jgi:hypothetical protein
MNEINFTALVKAIIDLGFPVGVAIWMLYRDAKWLTYLERHGQTENLILQRLANLLEQYKYHTHGPSKTDQRPNSPGVE